MGVKIAPDARRQFINASGVPYSGAKLFYYGAGSTTKQNTYTTSTGGVANSNPIILDSAGRTPYGVWFTEGLSYKEVLAPSTDTDPPSSPIYTEDNLVGVNDTVVAVSQWEASQLTPTYVSSTSFTVPGDQTSDLHVGRRLELSVTAGTVYARVSASVYGALTTVTVVMDSGQALDSGLSSLNWSILTATNHGIPKLSSTLLTGIGIANTTDYAPLASPTFTGTVTIPTVAIAAGTIAGITDLAIADGGTGASTAATAFSNLKQAATESSSGAIEIASSAEVTLGLDTTRAVPAAYLPFHPFLPKAWVTFNGTAGVGAISPLASAGITSVSKASTGVYTITFNFTFANANYAMSWFAQDDNSNGGTVITRHAADAKTTTSTTVRCFDTTAAGVVDSAYISLIFHGER